jgi:N-methylhydantoinase A
MMSNKGRATGCRIGIDVGGTFTDFVLANRATGAITRYKEPSVPDDPSLSVERGIPPLIERAGVKSSDVELIVHGTTLAVNAIIQRRGAKLGLVVSKGNRGVLEIGRARLANSYDFTVQKEEPLVPRNLVLETTARIMFDGTVIGRPEPGEIEAIAQQFVKADVAAVTVMLLHSYAHPTVEHEVAEQLRKAMPGIPVTESAYIWPERREYERCLVALMNAYVQPLMDDYFKKLNTRVEKLGIRAPIYITANNGGTLSLETARDRPIDTIMSGPASGVVAATIAARPTGFKRLITVDMGGTSADMAVSQGGDPEYTTQTHVGDFPLIVPVVNVSAIGAGGGSIIWVDPQGVLKVGPHSAGAAPGPVCYGRGGKEPTVTDCYLLTGIIHPDHFLGGRMKLDIDAARNALAAIADKIGIDGPDKAVKAAEAALRVTTAIMSTEIYKGLAQRGEDPREYALMAFGGAGPTHSNLLAQEARIGTIVVPGAPSTFCALGAILADVKRDYVKSRHLKLGADPEALSKLSETYREIETDAARWIEKEGDLLGETTFDGMADMRYAGQAFDLQVAIPGALRHKPDLAAISELFHREHEKIYSFRDLDSGVEVTTERVRVTGKIPPIELPTLAANPTPAKPIGKRPVFHEGAFHQADVYLRKDLGAGQKVAGPAIIEQEDTTIWIVPSYAGEVDGIGNILIRAKK